jgi:anti-sigma regulatory factor (Ser/Thr protein kinase)
VWTFWRVRQQREMKKQSNFNRDFLLKLELRSHPRLLCAVRGAMDPLMEMVGFSETECRSITRAVDEALSNIMRHAYRGRLDEVIDISCRHIQRRAHSGTVQGVEILLFDRGPSIDPAKLKGRPLDEIRPGGLGLHLIREAMDIVEYTRTGRSNRLRLVKYARPSTRRESTGEKSS